MKLTHNETNNISKSWIQFKLASDNTLKMPKVNMISLPAPQSELTAWSVESNCKIWVCTCPPSISFAFEGLHGLVRGNTTCKVKLDFQNKAGTLSRFQEKFRTPVVTENVFVVKPHHQKYLYRYSTGLDVHMVQPVIGYICVECFSQKVQ